MKSTSDSGAGTTTTSVHKFRNNRKSKIGFTTGRSLCWFRLDCV